MREPRVRLSLVALAVIAAMVAARAVYVVVVWG